MNQLTRGELIKLYTTLEDNRLTLDSRIEDIRNKQLEILDRQLDIREEIYTLDIKSGWTTCPACFALLSKGVLFCDLCGEEL